jgi:anti-sigma regulatory factor (Ser/Thr protein kinase)
VRATKTHATGGPAPAHLEHPALLYESTEDFLSYMVPYVAGGVEQGDVVFVAARGDNLAALRSEIGPRGKVRWADTREWHPHTGTRLRAFHQFVTDELAGGAHRIRLAGEPVWPDGPPEAVREWQRYESVLNHVLAPYPVTLVCLYDTARLDPSIIATSRRTHPAVHQNARDQASGTYVAPERFLAEPGPDLSPVPAGAAELATVSDLSSARRFVTEHALLAGLSSERAGDLCVAANEVLSNAVVHGGGVADLLLWSQDGRFICQIEDRGHGVADPLAGYHPPSGDAWSGRGLWLSRQLVDLVQIAPRPPRGTSVRLQIRPS